MKKNMKLLGDILRQYRIEKGISQKDLATQIEVDYSFLCKVEKNEKKISLDKLEKIAAFMEVNYDDLKICFYSEKILNIFSKESSSFTQKTLNKLMESYNV